jgi:DNA repair photolyase
MHHLPFPSEAAPALFQDLLVEPEEARSILRPQRDDRYGFGYTLSPYRGCSHGCRYCFVREYPNALHGCGDWGGWVTPKLNAPGLLWSQRHRLHQQSVFLSTATDPYQPIEREYRLTRACLKVLLDCPTCRVLIHTRSALVIQDLDLLKAFGDRISVGFSIPTDDDTVRQVVEPKAPPIPTRWAAVERLAKAGIAVNVAVTPLMAMADPGGFARRARESGVSGLWVGSLRLLKNDPFYDILVRNHWLKVLDPDYVEEIRDILRDALPSVRRGASRSRTKAPKPKPSLLASPALILAQPVHPGLFEGFM